MKTETAITTDRSAKISTKIPTKIPIDDPSSSTIVIVDDDPLQLQMLEKILSNTNYQTIGYTDNTVALKEIAGINPDLILLDLIMPKMDGLEMCRILKSDEATRHIPVIFVTSENDQLTESKGFELGAVDYITKPFNAVVTLARVRTHIELKRHRDSQETLIAERTAERDKSQQQFQDLVEKSMVGIAIIEEGRVIYQNPELKRTVADLALKLRERDFSFIHEDCMSPLKLAYENILKENTTHVEADVKILADTESAIEKSYKWLNCRASRFRYRDRDTLLINVVDISHTKELEKLLFNRNKMTSLGRIAAGMAHEIRNPLTGITSYLYSLEQIAESETVVPNDIVLMREIISQLKLASHKVDAVIKRVLDFSKPTAPQMVPMDINQCLTNVLNLTTVTLRKAGIEITTALARRLPHCYGDVGLIEQVLLNLVQNAGRALKGIDGPKKIAVSTYAHANHLTIAVSDSGPGVADHHREKIFDPFFTTHPDGSGIGLSIAQRIVTDHDGTLAIEDSQLGGAHFTITLPIEKRKYSR